MIAGDKNQQRDYQQELQVVIENHCEYRHKLQIAQEELLA